MSQIFQADAQNGGAGGTLLQNSKTTLVTTNGLNPPFGNCKVKLIGNVAITTAAGTSALAIEVRRNPAGENALVASFTVAAAAAAAQNFPFMCFDKVPDGRNCIYALNVTTTGANATGTFDATCYLEAMAISG